MLHESNSGEYARLVACGIKLFDQSNVIINKS